MEYEELCLHGKPVTAINQKLTLKKFLSWLDDESLSLCILVAHNARAFDARKISSNIKNCDLVSEFEEAVTGFVDTYPAFKK